MVENRHAYSGDYKMNGNEHKPASGIEKNAGTDNENIGKKTPKAVPEEELVFYYNRAERLERAGENVRRYYDGTAPKPPKGLFKALVHTKQSRVMLFAVILSALVVLAVAFLTGKTDSQSADGVRFSLSAFSFEDSVYVSVKLSPEKNAVSDGTVFKNIVFSALDNDKKTLISQKIWLIYGGNETYCRTIFADYDIVYVQADIEAEDKKLTLLTKVVQK